MRGNLFQIFPMGCMRVFITSSCSSLAIRFMRCEITLKSGVLRVVGELQQLVARQHQLADQIHQPVQQADADADRLHRRLRPRALQNLLRASNVLQLAQSQRHQNLSHPSAISAFLLL